MNPEIIASIIGAIISLVIGSGVSIYGEYFVKLPNKYPNSKIVTFLQKIQFIKKDKPVSYRVKLTKSIKALETASREVDNSLSEIKILGDEKQKSLEFLETQLNELSIKENELKDRVAALQNIPIESIKHFEAIINKENKRSAIRDYVLFGLGVLVSTIVAIILNYVQ